MEVGDDCVFFLKGTCSWGPACRYRHVEEAREASVCEDWLNGQCYAARCPRKHFQQQKPCYWETQPSGCQRPGCDYRHQYPRPFEEAGPAALVCTPAKQAASGSPTAKADSWGYPSAASNGSSGATASAHPAPAAPSEDKVAAMRARLQAKAAAVASSTSPAHKTAPSKRKEFADARLTSPHEAKRSRQQRSPAPSPAGGLSIGKRVLPTPKRHDESKMPTRRATAAATTTSKRAVTSRVGRPATAAVLKPKTIIIDNKRSATSPAHSRLGPVKAAPDATKASAASRLGNGVAVSRLSNLASTVGAATVMIINQRNAEASIALAA